MLGVWKAPLWWYRLSSLRTWEMQVVNLRGSKCKGPNLGMNLVCWRTRKSMALGGEGDSGREMPTQEGNKQVLSGLVGLETCLRET